MDALAPPSVTPDFFSGNTAPIGFRDSSLRPATVWCYYRLWFYSSETR